MSGGVGLGGDGGLAVGSPQRVEVAVNALAAHHKPPHVELFGLIPMVARRARDRLAEIGQAAGTRLSRSDKISPVIAPVLGRLSTWLDETYETMRRVAFHFY